ncbi:LysR family transcriptional regulator [Microvirga antarctica]|uniref:LysR family transcriptional regulator n=1 Tax=Microvirga antarctica TaxID=2819233 RepID=UPI001B31026C
MTRRPSPLDKAFQVPASYTVSIKHLRAFLRLAHHRSFTRAAMDLHMSQPSLTMTIRQLEDIIGSSLFDRTTRNVILTPEGQDFVPIAERVVGDFDLAIQNIRVAASARKGRIGIALNHSVAIKVIPKVLESFLADHPGLHVQLRDGNSADVRRRVRRNEVDIGFGSKDEEDTDLDFRPLFRDRMGLLARSDHPLAAKQASLEWADLAGYDFVGLTSDTATGRILDQIAYLPPSVTAPRYEVSTNPTLWALLESGIGITTAPAMSVENNPNPLLRFFPLSNPVAWRDVYLITRRGRILTPTANDIVRRVSKEVAAIARGHTLIEPYAL